MRETRADDWVEYTSNEQFCKGYSGVEVFGMFSSDSEHWNGSTVAVSNNLSKVLYILLIITNPFHSKSYLNQWYPSPSFMSVRSTSIILPSRCLNVIWELPYLANGSLGSMGSISITHFFCPSIRYAPRTSLWSSPRKRTFRVGVEDK